MWNKTKGNHSEPHLLRPILLSRTATSQSCTNYIYQESQDMSYWARDVIEKMDLSEEKNDDIRRYAENVLKSSRRTDY